MCCRYFLLLIIPDIIYVGRFLDDSRLMWQFNSANICPVFGWWHLVKVGCIASVSVTTLFIFKVKWWPYGTCQYLSYVSTIRTLSQWVMKKKIYVWEGLIGLRVGGREVIWSWCGEKSLVWKVSAVQPFSILCYHSRTGSVFISNHFVCYIFQYKHTEEI